MRQNDDAWFMSCARAPSEIKPASIAWSRKASSFSLGMVQVNTVKSQKYQYAIHSQGIFILHDNMQSQNWMFQRDISNHNSQDSKV